ncbi:MAG: hypothetical protein E7478_03510 [Ruminococcaceae bacterium]|nr:hypothetical protein [Oscillospiraceae bacterium]
MMVIIKCFIVAVIAVALILASAFIVKKLKKELPKAISLIGCIFGVFAILLSCIFANHTGVLYEEVRFTALGEHNPEASADEIVINHYTVDNKQYKIKPPVEGKWMWYGESYMWRIEEDTRKPDGMTRSIVLKVPVGLDRTINLSMDKWKGMVEIELDGNQTVIDCFKEGGDVSFESSRGTKICALMLYGLHVAVYMAAMFAVILTIQFAFADEKNKLHRFRYHMIYAVIAASSLLICVPLFDDKSFWLDEMFQVSFSGNGRSVYETLMLPETTPPLFRVIANIWYNIVPYGQGWLLLLSALAVCGAIYFIGLVGKEICNESTGVLCAVLMATSTAVISNASLQYRTYGFVLLFSSLYLLYSIKRIKKGNDATWRDIVVMGAVTIPLTYTHYFGVFLCVAMFSVDLLLWLSKQVKAKVVFAYIIPFVAYIPWLICFITGNHIGNNQATWQHQPSLSRIIDYISYFCSDNEILTWMFYAGAITVVASIIIKLKNNTYEHRKDIAPAIPLMLIIVMFGMLFIYGKFSPNATLWIERYFFVIVPCVFAVQAHAVYCVGQAFKEHSAHAGAMVAAVLIAVTLPSTYTKSTSANFKPVHYYRDCAEWIYKQINYVYNDDCIVVMTGNSYVAEGFYEFYMTKRGIRDDVNFIRIANIKDDSFLDQYNTIIYCSYRANSSSDNDFIAKATEGYKQVKRDDGLNITVYDR